MFKRKSNLSVENKESFFLWGPRQSGKTTLLKSLFNTSVWIDLLKSDQFRMFMQSPNRLREIVQADPTITHVVIDEIQKVPDLLDEIHWLIENTGVHFAMCGSSARKLKRGGANLLGGRAIRYELHGLIASEISDAFELERMLNHGYLPRHYLSNNPRRMLNSYVSDYLKEEIAAEGIVRNLPSFADFLSSAALSDGEIVNFSTIARDCGVSSKTVKSYFEILEDTLLATFLPSYRKKLKRRTIQAPKFYFSDVGVVNFLSKRGHLESGSELFGKAFENWVYHELITYNAYSESYADISYWRLASGIEVDFVIDDFSVAIEAKSTRKIKSDHLKGLRRLKEQIGVSNPRIIICLEPFRRMTDDGILILPYQEFINDLWQGKVFS
jgi:uncharacterized protein